MAETFRVFDSSHSEVSTSSGCCRGKETPCQDFKNYILIILAEEQLEREVGGRNWQLGPGVDWQRW